jgi:hypothetical protein
MSSMDFSCLLILINAFFQDLRALSANFFQSHPVFDFLQVHHTLSKSLFRSDFGVLA